MPRSHDPVEEAIYRRKPTTAEQVEGLGLFDTPAVGAAEQELRDTFLGPPKPSLEMPGAGQLARKEARERTDADGDRQRVLDLLRQHPEGLTRRQIAERLEVSVNTVNARVAELCDPKRYSPTLAYTEGHRESVVEEHGKRRLAKESVVFAREGTSRG